MSVEERLVHHFLELNARRLPEKVAYIQDEYRQTYRQLNAKANEFASWLLQKVGPGARVALLLENSVPYVVSYFGALKAGCVAVPLNAELRKDQLIPILQQLQPQVVVAGRRSERLLREISLDGTGVNVILLHDPSLAWHEKDKAVIPLEDVLQEKSCLQSDPAVPIEERALSTIIFTSGSTGKPKGVMLSHANIVANTYSIADYLHVSESDIQMIVLPFHYVMGKSLLNTHFAIGGTVVVNNRFAYPSCVIEQMVAEGVTSFSGVPSTYAYLLHRSPLRAFRDKLHCLRYCSQAGGHMSREMKVSLLQALPAHTQLYVMYGATEAAARLAYVEPAQLLKKIDSIGRPIPGVTIRVIDDAGNEVAEGEIGELVAQGPNIMLGYWSDPEGTSLVLDQNGYHTGDLGYRDADGYLYLIGRKDSLLKVGGHRISPQEIEDVLMSSGLILEAVVVGVQDDMLGHRMVALAVPLVEKADATELFSHCLERLPRYKLPSQLRFVKALPKHANGKIDRMMCHNLLVAMTDTSAEETAIFAS